MLSSKLSVCRILDILKFSFVLSFGVSIVNGKSLRHEYFWRDYSGVIPHDAIPAGKNSYIGQTYVHRQGNFVFQIFPDSKIYEVAAHGYKTSDKVVKILCSNNVNKFSWTETSSRTFQVDVIGKNLVIGGYDYDNNNKRMLYVGRYNSKIGSVHGHLSNAVLKYINSTEREASKFEVLTFVSDGTIVPFKNVQDCTINDFYWREFDGKIPEDAVVTGSDIEGEDAYLGQAYIHNAGVFIVQLNPGKKKIEVPAYGFKTTDHNIKILCSNVPNSLTWVRTTALDIKTDLNRLTGVVGGLDTKAGHSMHIGRIFYQGIVIVGNVGSNSGGYFWFPFDNIERHVDVYEVLTYNKCTKPDYRYLKKAVCRP